MIVARTWMIFVVLPMRVSAVVMVGAVFGPTVKPFLVRTLVRPVEPVMKLSVPSVVARMPIIVVMGVAGRGRQRQQHRAC